MTTHIDQVIKILYETMPLARFNIVLQAATKIHELYHPPENTEKNETTEEKALLQSM